MIRVSTGEAGPPLASSGEQIREREFATVRRGYDPDQVRAYLQTLGAHVDALERAVLDARARVAELESAAAARPQIDPYEQVSKRFAGVLATADAEAEGIVDQARDEAERIRAEAKARAEEVRIRSSHSLIAAQEESERMMAGLASRREAMLGQLHEMQARLLSVADDLEVAIQPRPTEAAPAAPPGPAPPQPPPAHPEPTPDARGPGDSTPIEDLWVASEPAPTFPSDVMAPPRSEGASPDEVDLPDLSDLDLDLDLDEGRGSA